MSDTRTHLDLMYEKRTGFIELSYINGDPDIKTDKKRGTKAIPLTSHVFYQWPRDAELAIGRINYLAKRYGNVYVSLSLHSQRKRTYATALPSRVLWLDDVQPCDDFSFVIQTSEKSYHGYMLLDRELPATERRDLQARLKRKYWR